ncbi:MAG: nucleoside hydrolase [Acidobacteria bacterium]|nr:nucleoside hydrolase [Acidobacteriota bacterium]
MKEPTRRNLLTGGAVVAAAPLAGWQGLPQGASLEQRLLLPQGQVNAVVDSDTYNEIDDQFAVAYALLSPAHMEIEAVYAAPFHNERSASAGDGMRKSYQEILRILARLGGDPKGFAFAGSETFLQQAGKPVDSPAARDLVAKALKPRTAPLYVITIGAPTNVSSAILMEPKIKDRIVVVWLGGQPYDWPTAREFNLQQDLHASRVLHDSGVALVNIPTQNVSEHLRTTVAEVERFLKGKSPIADYLCSEFVAYAKWKSPGPDFAWSKVIWDISAVAWLIQPKWIPTRLAPSPVLTDDYRYRTEAGRHHVRVAVDVNRDQVFNDLFHKLARANAR